VSGRGSRRKSCCHLDHGSMRRNSSRDIGAVIRGAPLTDHRRQLPQHNTCQQHLGSGQVALPSDCSRRRTFAVIGDPDEEQRPFSIRGLPASPRLFQLHEFKRKSKYIHYALIKGKGALEVGNSNIDVYSIGSPIHFERPMLSDQDSLRTRCKSIGQHCCGSALALDGASKLPRR
jgi:hypothetical protein